MKVPARLPILLNHDEDDVVGYADSQSRSASALTLAGPVIADEAAGKRVVTMSDSGFPLTASVGLTIQRTEEVAKGRTAQVNGRTVQGPITVWRETSLHETSFVTANPADKATTAMVLSGHKPTDSPEEWAASVARRTGVTLAEAMALRGDGEKLDAFNTALRLGLDGAPLRAAARGQVSKLTIEAMAETAQKESA